MDDKKQTIDHEELSSVQEELAETKSQLYSIKGRVVQLEKLLLMEQKNTEIWKKLFEELKAKKYERSAK